MLYYLTEPEAVGQSLFSSPSTNFELMEATGTISLLEMECLRELRLRSDFEGVLLEGLTSCSA